MASWTQVKNILKSLPLIRECLTHFRGRGDQFTTSSDYWEQRYKTGGNSGAGSYNRLAEFKANFLNRFVIEHEIRSVIEFGSGDGAQLKLASYPSYTGVDIAPKAVEMCRVLFSGDNSKRFLHWDEVIPGSIAELSLSLDVIYHLVEDRVFDDHMRRLFESSQRFVIVYSSNMDLDWPTKHVRHRQFTRWVEQNKPEWRHKSTLKNAYPYDSQNPDETSFADFYVFALR
jgi:hypothetical protein